MFFEVAVVHSIWYGGDCCERTFSIRVIRHFRPYTKVSKLYCFICLYCFIHVLCVNFEMSTSFGRLSPHEPTIGRGEGFPGSLKFARIHKGKCDDASTTIFPKGQLLNCFIEVTYSLTLHKSLALGTFQVDLVVLALGKNLALGEVKLHWL